MRDRRTSWATWTTWTTHPSWEHARTVQVLTAIPTIKASVPPGAPPASQTDPQASSSVRQIAVLCGAVQDRVFPRAAVALRYTHYLLRYTHYLLRYTHYLLRLRPAARKPSASAQSGRFFRALVKSSSRVASLSVLRQRGRWGCSSCIWHCCAAPTAGPWRVGNAANADPALGIAALPYYRNGPGAARERRNPSNCAPLDCLADVTRTFLLPVAGNTFQNLARLLNPHLARLNHGQTARHIHWELRLWVPLHGESRDSMQAHARGTPRLPRLPCRRDACPARR